LFGDITGVKREQLIAQKLKDSYRKYWDGAMEEGVTLSHAAELTALVLAVIFYQDMIKNHVSEEDLAIMRRCIFDNLHDDELRPAIMFRIELTTLVANGWINSEIDGYDFALALRDIHRAIFNGDDEHLDKTIGYFIEGANRIKAQAKGTDS
jgi:hypothetical protein